MTVSFQLMKPLKRYLRQTWLYPTKMWIDRYRPSGVKHHQKFLEFYSQFCKAGDLCFDIGANVGNRTTIFAELGAKTVSCEPQAACLERLHQRFDRNPNVVIVNQALGEYQGFAELSICEDASTISTMSDRWKTAGRFSHQFEWRKTQTVPVTTLDQLINIYGLPAFCKIDVEGFELSVLKGLTQPIPCLSFEFNIEMIDELKACIAYLQTIASVELNYSIAETMEFVFTKWVSAEHLLDHLQQSGDSLLWGDIYVKLTEKSLEVDR